MSTDHTDLIARLKDFAGNPMLRDAYAKCMDEAADSIAALVAERDAVARANDALNAECLRLGHQEADVAQLRAERDAAMADAQRLDYLEGDAMTRVFKIGKTWYWKPEYRQPHRKATTLRVSIDAARKSNLNE
jgi:hypothetical protein